MCAACCAHTHGMRVSSSVVMCASRKTCAHIHHGREQTIVRVKKRNLKKVTHFNDLTVDEVSGLETRSLSF